MKGTVGKWFKSDSVSPQRPPPKTSVRTGYTLLGNYAIELGSPENRARHRYRFLKVLDSKGNPLQILTNIRNLAAWKICLLYRYRWTIEIVFRWIKRSLQVKSFVGYSATAVQRQLLMALIVYCLLVLYHSGQKRPFSPTQLLRELQIALAWLLYWAGYTQARLEAGLPPPKEMPKLEARQLALPKEVPCRVTLLQTT
ncbi:MAG: hypothetical protein COS85_17925 [Armatimonadetes bacterium CG07_land_8_20_14_0_80_59_28]|nr:MAG: hypothetical protein COS85_17925 [Armatimonadetes bacterium CG07_land_8_20_14_0_80_59_28]PIX39353.1 MAG: hypothetical protein COZ56_17850 [Armatimonadetes bacterium CG_4_8_14_3_um_filter_58_9]PIY42400.1 MAG: hypothetical protein COZ05_13980 [Armatimonadetes bacterium CG_4_10_14_3_um_filter_59_10]PJB67212.1 MAG: hypothetical protein CO095_12330 [Armatimonadetes bacterium CG_4_9_14_3_um_filter_58_7]